VWRRPRDHAGCNRSKIWRRISLQLALEYVRTAQLLLESDEEDEETENNDGE
jgi:hypothetical protein